MPSCLASISATFGDRFSSRSSLTLTRATHARIGFREDGSELQILLGQVRVVLEHILAACAAQKHPADLTDGEARPRKNRLAAQDGLVGNEPRLPGFEASKFPFRILRDSVESNLEH